MMEALRNAVLLYHYSLKHRYITVDFQFQPFAKYAICRCDVRNIFAINEFAFVYCFVRDANVPLHINAHWR